DLDRRDRRDSPLESLPLNPDLSPKALFRRGDASLCAHPPAVVVVLVLHPPSRGVGDHGRVLAARLDEALLYAALLGLCAPVGEEVRALTRLPRAARLLVRAAIEKR